MESGLNAINRSVVNPSDFEPYMLQDPNIVRVSIGGVDYNYAGEPIGKTPTAPVQQTAPTGGGGGGGDALSAREIAENAERTSLRGDISGYQDDIESLYSQLIKDLEALVNTRKGELEGEYGEQLSKVGAQYAGAIPEIETSYAAIGAADSTDNTYAKVDAKKGFEDTTKTIGKNKADDEAALGKYSTETKTAFETDRDSANREIGRAGKTEDVGALRSMRNSIETNMDTAKNTRATLATDKGAQGALKKATADSGRYDAAVGALDSLLKSSLSGGVKQAAVKAITDSAGLSDEEKAKVDQQFGNVYSEQAAL